MSNTKTISSSSNSLYKLQDTSSNGFVSNAFPVRPLVRTSFDNDQAWIAAYKAENQKYFEAVLTNQRLEEIEKDQLQITKEQKIVPKRQILKQTNFAENNEAKKPGCLDGFFLIQNVKMQMFCVEDPLDLSAIDLSDKGLNQIKEEDMFLFENVVEINANENSLTFDAFRNFVNLKNLFLACNNIKSIRVKHEEFLHLETLDLSFNNLSPTDVSHLGILNNLRVLKLTGNNLSYLPDTFSKLYVYTKDNKKNVLEKFGNLEELYLDQNKLREEDSFDVLAVFKKLKRLHLNANCITCIPNLKIFRKNHVFQEFNKSYYKRKNKRNQSASAKRSDSKFLKLNESMVKDLERPNSELNIHNSNVLRNSFILEEEEVEEEASKESSSNNNNNNDSLPQQVSDDTKKPSDLSSTNGDNGSFDLPFAELVYINLADNQIAEEDDLIALASWPMLNEIIIYGNPIVYNNVGYPPLLKQYLIDRLGMNIQRIRPLKPLKTPILVPQREHRIVESVVPKIPKMPVEMRMLTYYQDGEAASRRSNVSSAESIKNGAQRSSGGESLDTGGHLKNDNVYKPFKQDKVLNNFRESQSREGEEDGEFIDSDAQLEKENMDKNYNSFFMTQIEQEETQPNRKPRRPRSQSSSARSDASRHSLVEPKFKNYEILLKIENEERIKVPKDLKGSVKALRQMLEHPLVYRDPAKELDKPQTTYKSILKPEAPIPKARQRPKIAQVNEILDSLRERKTIQETSLIEALSNKTDKRELKKSKKLLEQVQNKYNDIKRESLKSMHAQKGSKQSHKAELDRIESESDEMDDEDDDAEAIDNDSVIESDF